MQGQQHSGGRQLRRTAVSEVASTIYRSHRLSVVRRWCMLLLLLVAACDERSAAHFSTMVLWAWERPEDLRFAPSNAEIAVQTGFVGIDGSDLVARGRGFPLLASRTPDTVVVHIQIDERRPVRWSPALRRRVVAATLHYATLRSIQRVQIDFEVPASERPILIDVLTDVRHALPPNTLLSMTALASWCDGERWLDAAPVDEIVPMVFRMGRSASVIKRRLANGGDFADRRCRTAIGIATDEPIERAPPGRRVYVFDPTSWTVSRFTAARSEVDGWR